MKLRRFLWFFWSLVLFIAAMIFYFSAQNADMSSKSSGVLAQFVLHLFHPDYDSLSYREKTAILTRWQLIVRKGAHFTEFAMLGASLRLLLQALQVRRWKLVWCWGIGTLYACTDEIHQMFVDGRGPSPIDVGIDSAGVLFGAAVITLLFWWAGRRRRKKEEKTQ